MYTCMYINIIKTYENYIYIILHITIDDLVPGYPCHWGPWVQIGSSRSCVEEDLLRTTP